jgi:hypothetical protein
MVVKSNDKHLLHSYGSYPYKLSYLSSIREMKSIALDFTLANGAHQVSIYGNKCIKCNLLMPSTFPFHIGYACEMFWFKSFLLL